MPSISVGLSSGCYEIRIEPGVLFQAGALAQEAAPSGHCALIADAHVHGLYGGRLEHSLNGAGYQVVTALQSPGEESKNLDTVRRLYDVLIDAGLDRASPVISLGGGVNGDTAGFVAATYLRGVPFIQCPTSLLSMVDASVGGKVGVNVAQGKNLVGSFHQPRAVLVDPSVLTSLPEREMRCGLAECVKHAVIQDAALFAWLDKNITRILARDEGALIELLERNIAIKARVVEQDEKEQGLRGILNFGHTFAHAVEKTSGYGVIEHGEAVALGMLAASRLAICLKLCDEEVWIKLSGLLGRIALPLQAKLASADELLSAMRSDKKRKDGVLRFVVPLGIGSVRFITDPGEAALREAWAAVSA